MFDIVDRTSPMGSPPPDRRSPADETPSRNTERSETDQSEADRSSTDGSSDGIDVEFPTHPALMSSAKPSVERSESTEPAPTRSDADRFVSVVAVDGEVMFAGPSVPAMLGVDRREFRGDDFLAYVHPTERTRVSDALSAVSTERRVTHRLRDASGGYRRVVSVVDEELAPDLGGRVVTSRRVGVERDAPESFRAFLEYGTDIVTIVGDAGRVRYESPSVEHVLGYEQGSLVGQSPLGYVHPADRDRVTERFYEALADPTCVSALEYRYRTAGGDWVWLESRARGLPEDAVGALVINSRDITERKRRERRLVDRNERLDRFASIVSHDLRNPLAVIRSSIEMARLEADTEPLERGERAVDRIDQLVSELLTLARQGAEIDEPTEFGLEDVVRDAWTTAGADGAELVVAGDARIRADRSRLRQAFENLFRNSVEHSSTSSQPEPDDSVEHSSTGSQPKPDHDPKPSDGVTVVVDTTADGIVVADDGPGIAAANRSEVFDSGFTTRTHGTGYGLDIVREIVEAHGWRVDIADRDDEFAEGLPDGARFEIRAPTPDTADPTAPWIER
ncbi:MAG: PAS sensor histidine kinase [uncultured archaeon A07HR67]|nr:MAG: PAS sensor histidine kinase [uncultured archaeon A07HR67]